MNRPAIIKAAYFMCLALGDDPTVRNVAEQISRARGGKGFRVSLVTEWLSTNRETNGKRSGSISETNGKQETRSNDPVREIEGKPNGKPSRAPHKVLESERKIPLEKPARFLSAYAGTKVDDFGDLNALVQEVLAADGFKTGTKGLAKALESLAMWRAIYGLDAFRRGLEVAADKRYGHRYVGGVAKNYDPDRDRARDYSGREYEPNESDLLPTITELVAEGVLPSWELSPETLAARPASLLARLAALAND